MLPGRGGSSGRASCSMTLNLDDAGRLGSMAARSKPAKDAIMHRYRSHTCADLRPDHVGQDVRLSGWCHRIRDHGGLLFIDLRDHYGLTQCVVDPDSPAFKIAETLRSEWVVRVDGHARRRPE